MGVGSYLIGGVKVDVVVLMVLCICVEDVGCSGVLINSI